MTCTANCATVTWVDKSGNLPDIPIDSILVNPRYSRQVFAGSDWGLYYTDDIAAAPVVWRRFQAGLPNVAIFSLRADRSAPTRSAWTGARGAYVWPLPAGRVNPSPTPPANSPTPAPTATPLSTATATASADRSLLSGNGYVEFTVVSVDQEVAFGLSRADPYPAYNTLDYAVYTRPGAGRPLEIFEGGVRKATLAPTSWATPCAGRCRAGSSPSRKTARSAIPAPRLPPTR